MQIHSINATPQTFKGWTPTKPENKDKINQIIDIINNKKIDTIAISGHMYPDIDSIGACYAMAHLLHAKTGKHIDIYSFGKIPERFKILEDPDFMTVINISDNPYAMYKVRKPYDLAISLDTAASIMMDQDYYRQIFSRANNKIKIDHHLPQGSSSPSDIKYQNYADINFVDPDSPSASEMVMQFVKPLGLNPRKLPQNFNKAVYAGILSDTGNFAYAKIPTAFYDAYLLVHNGLKPENSSEYMSKKISRETLDIVTLARQNVKYSPSGKIAYVLLDDTIEKRIRALKDRDLMKEANSKIKTFVHSLRNVEGVEVSLFAKEQKDGLLNLSFRTENFDIRKFAAKYGGGGHEHAVSIMKNIDRDQELIVEEIVKDLEKDILSSKKKKPQ